MSLQPARVPSPPRQRMAWASHLSLEASLPAAAEACVAAIREQLRGAPDLLTVFVSGLHRSQARELPGLLLTHFPRATVIGCTGGGIIGGGHEAEGVAALSVTAAILPDVEVRAFHRDSDDMPDLDGPAAAWETWMDVPVGRKPSFILLPDPFSFDVESCLLGLDYAYPGRPKIGGLASSGERPGENILFVNDHIHRTGLAGLSLSGALHVDALVAQGCRPIGKPMVITECLQNVILTLDRKTPLAMLQELVKEIDERDRKLMGHSLFLGVETDPFAGDFLVRNVLGLDGTRGTLAVGALLRHGQRVQFHLRDARTSAEDLQAHCLRLRQRRRGTPSAALMFSCLGRGRRLYGSADHDVHVFQRVLGETPIGGFFCAGEIGPVGQATYVHGYTSSFAIFTPIDVR